MAASKITTELSSLVECPICMETLDKPVAFPCMHFYCQTCINSLPATQTDQEQGICCPICGKFALNMNMRPVSFIQDILQLLDISTELNKNCDICKSNEAMIDCQQCKQVFCHQCAKTHKRFTLFKNHTLTQIEERATMVDEHIFCKIHQEEVVKLYCKDCKTLVCVVCQATKHKTHQVQTVQGALRDILPDVGKNLERTGHSLANKRYTLQPVEGSHASVLKQCAEFEAAVEDCSLEAIRVIKEATADIKYWINYHRTHHTEEASGHICGYKRDIKHHTNLISMTAVVLEKTKDVSLLATLTKGLSEALETADQTVTKEITWDILPQLTQLNTKLSNCFEDLTKKYIMHREFSIVAKHKWILVKRRALHCNAWSLHIFYNQIWLGSRSSKVILVMSLDGIPEEVVFTYTGPCRFFKQAWEGRVCAKNDGLSFPDNQGIMKQNPICGDYCDSSFHAGWLYALTYTNEVARIKKVFCFYSLWPVIRLKGCISDYRNTIEVTDKGIFVGQFRGDVITLHDFTGAMTASYGGSGQLCGPRLCGTDTQVRLLIADWGHNKLQTLNTASGKVETIFERDDLLHPMFAAIYGNTCYILDQNGLSIYKAV